MHKVQQILEAAAAVCIANTNLVALVEVNRIRSLAEEEQELPALTINYGPDAPDESETFESLGSAIEIVTTAYCAGDTEQEVLASLLQMRSQVHVSLMADMSLGLPFLWEIRYGGADAPLVVQGERTLGSLTCRWNARYQMDNDDPQ
jgi:hypothetical protein